MANVLLANFVEVEPALPVVLRTRTVPLIRLASTDNVEIHVRLKQPAVVVPSVVFPTTGPFASAPVVLVAIHQPAV